MESRVGVAPAAAGALQGEASGALIHRECAASEAEVALLVLGYLKESNFTESCKTFERESAALIGDLKVRYAVDSSSRDSSAQRGNKSPRRLKSLWAVISEYVTLKEEERVRKEFLGHYGAAHSSALRRSGQGQDSDATAAREAGLHRTLEGLFVLLEDYREMRETAVDRRHTRPPPSLPTLAPRMPQPQAVQRLQPMARAAMSFAPGGRIPPPTLASTGQVAAPRRLAPSPVARAPASGVRHANASTVAAPTASTAPRPGPDSAPRQDDQRPAGRRSRKSAQPKRFVGAAMPELAEKLANVVNSTISQPSAASSVEFEEEDLDEEGGDTQDGSRPQQRLGADIISFLEDKLDYREIDALINQATMPEISGAARRQQEAAAAGARAHPGGGEPQAKRQRQGTSEGRSVDQDLADIDGFLSTLEYT